MNQNSTFLAGVFRKTKEGKASGRLIRVQSAEKVAFQDNTNRQI